MRDCAREAHCESYFVRIFSFELLTLYFLKSYICQKEKYEIPKIKGTRRRIDKDSMDEESIRYNRESKRKRDDHSFFLRDVGNYWFLDRDYYNKGQAFFL